MNVPPVMLEQFAPWLQSQTGMWQGPEPGVTVSQREAVYVLSPMKPSYQG
jgi:hypothetical protein